MEAAAATASSTLASYLSTLRRRAWILALCLVIIPATAVFIAERGGKLYQASSEIYANGDDFAAVLTGIETSAAGGNTAENIVYLSLTPRVARRTLRALGRADRSPNYLLGQTSVLQKGGSDFFVVSVTDRDSIVAAQLATEYARQIIKYRTELTTAAVANARRLAARKLDELEAAGKSRTVLYRSLKQKDQELEALAALQTSRLSVVRTPTHGYRVAPRPKRAAALGIFLGLVVGVGLMFLFEALDPRVRSGTEIAEELDLPLLARIPPPPRKIAARDGLVMLARPAGQDGESFRMLRTNLEFALLSGRVRTILLTSAVPKEGKSTTAANLAVALARGGRRIALVDLDLRRPHLNRFFNLPGTPGITDVAAGAGNTRGGADPGRPGHRTACSVRCSERERRRARGVGVSRRARFRSTPARPGRVRRHEPPLGDPQRAARALRPRRDRLAADAPRRRRDDAEHEGRRAVGRQPSQRDPTPRARRDATAARLDSRRRSSASS